MSSDPKPPFEPTDFGVTAEPETLKKSPTAPAQRTVAAEPYEPSAAKDGSQSAAIQPVQPALPLVAPKAPQKTVIDEASPKMIQDLAAWEADEPSPASERKQTSSGTWVRRAWADKRIRGVIIALGVIVGLAGVALLYVTLRFDAILRDRIAAEAKECGIEVEFDQVESSGILPWQAGEPRVVLKNVKLKSVEAPGVEISVKKLSAPLKGTFPAYSPKIVQISDVEIVSPDLSALAALERSVKSGKGSKTPANVEGVKVTIQRVAQSLPVSVIARADGIDTGSGKVQFKNVTLEVPDPVFNRRIGPFSAEIERVEDITWARFNELPFARFGVQDDGSKAKVQAGPADSGQVGQKLGLDLPPMNITGDVEAQLKGADAMTGTFSITLDGYVPPHPREINGILHDNKTKVSGKLRYTEPAIFFDDLVVVSGGLTLKGKGKIDWAAGGVLSMNLSGAVACSTLASSVVSDRLGGLAGVITGELSKGRLTGSVGINVDINAKVSELKNLNISPRASIGCKVSLF